MGEGDKLGAMKKYLTLAILLLILVAGLPMAMPGDLAMACPSCPSGHMPIASLCLAVLGAALVFHLALLGRTARGSVQMRALLITATLLRPPRAL